MVAQIHEAQKLIAKGDAATFASLKPIRLQMAGAATGCFIACQHAIDQNGLVNSDMHLVRDGWERLAGRMRAITAVYQSPQHPEWLDYTAQARSLMADLLRHIALTRRVILVMDSDEARRACVR
ncbi:hypothetical protein [Sphingomonas sp. RS2018]